MRYVGWWCLLLAACVPGGEKVQDACGGADPCGEPTQSDTACGGSEDCADTGGDSGRDTAADTDSGAPSDTGDSGVDTGADTGPDTGTDTGTDTGDGVGEATWPADVLPLGEWKLTLPVPDPGDAERPMEVEQPELATFAMDPWFRLDDTRRAVRFAANAGGATTTNSKYPRSELREMTGGGAERAAWSTTEGVHTLTVTQAITHLPEVKPHVVTAQIHDADDDLMMIRLEGSRLFVEAQGEDMGVLDADYVLGEPYTARIVARDGWIEVYHEDLETPAVRFQRERDGCYFKAGAYTQTNPDRGDDPDAYAEVEIRALSVTHE